MHAVEATLPSELEGVRGGLQAIGAGLVSLHFVNVSDHRGLVAPFRGTDARFSTNPVCIALPGTDRQPPVLLDMATSSVAMGKIRVARNEGKPAPEGVLIDQNGKPTRDPNVMYSEPHGALLPFGGHKGYALAVVTELLAGALSGGATIQPGNERRGGTVNNMFTMLIDPARMAGLDWFRREIDGFVDYVKASPPADGAAPVLVPGDPERLAREERTRTGIAVDATTWEEVLEAGEKVGLALDRVDDPAIAMSCVDAHELAVEVDEAAAVDGLEMDAFGARHGQWLKPCLRRPVIQRVPKAELGDLFGAESLDGFDNHREIVLGRRGA